MCGFLGEFSLKKIEKQNFEELLSYSKLRGPDQIGFWEDAYCQLGFNRLSIIDLTENGSQPLTSPNGKFALVFNGEIYNYKEIQLKFGISDTVLRSSSDSEILAHLVEKVDIKTFANELNGMFAISIYDLEQKKIHLIRDFAGIKPLFYGLFEDGIVFASQFDQIFKHRAFKDKKLRPEVIKEFLSLGYMHAPNTVYENIFQVLPAQIITWDYSIKNIESKMFYWVWEVNHNIKETDPSAIIKFETVFDRVIKNQLNSDVPIATFLSGGIDSPLVAAFAKRHNEKINAFTIGVEDVRLNESEIANKISQKLKISQSIEKIDEHQVLNILDNHFSALSEPMGDFSSLPTYLITRKAKLHATVMLSGDGGDELFWGYPRFIKSCNQAKWFKLPLWLRKIIIPFYRKINPKISSALDVYDRFDEWIFSKQVHFKTDLLMPNINYTNELLDDYKFQTSINNVNVLNYLKKNEFYAHLQKVLRKVDLMSMANSLEVRVPFLDKELISYSNQLIPELVSEHSINKYVLKKSLAKYIGDDIVNLPKKGFTIPLESWLKNELKDEINEYLINKPIYGEEFFNLNELERLIKGFYENKKDINVWGIWHLYVWQKWAYKN